MAEVPQHEVCKRWSSELFCFFFERNRNSVWVITRIGEKQQSGSVYRSISSSTCCFVFSCSRFSPLLLHMSQFIYFVGSWHNPTDFRTWHNDQTTTIVALLLGDSDYASPLQQARIVSNPEDAATWLLRYQITRVPCCVEIHPNDDISKTNLPIDFNCTESVSTLATRAIDAYNAYRINDAAKTYATILHREPNHTDALFNIASIFHMHGFISLALPCLETLLMITPNDMIVQAFLWALSQGPGRDLAVATYQRLVEAGNVIATHKLAALRGSAVTNCAPAYAQHIFDDMAEVFEKRLVTDLEYNCPWLMRDMLQRYITSDSMENMRMLDLGCGSGLCGRLLGEINPTIILTGVDISPKMIDITRSYDVYKNLLVEDIMLELERHHEYDLILCADTFLYIGALGAAMHHMYQSLVPGGLLIFSTEDLNSSPMRSQGSSCEFSIEHEPTGDMSQYLQLLSSARFAHSTEYITVLASMHGFEVLEVKDVIIRKEQAVPLPGKIYLLKKYI